MTFKWDHFDLGNFWFISKNLPWAQTMASRERKANKQHPRSIEYSEDYPQAPTRWLEAGQLWGWTPGSKVGGGVSFHGDGERRQQEKQASKRWAWFLHALLGERQSWLQEEPGENVWLVWHGMSGGRANVYPVPQTLEHFIGSTGDPETSSSSLVSSWLQHFPNVSPSRWSQKHNSIYNLILKDVVGSRSGWRSCSLARLLK